MYCSQCGAPNDDSNRFCLQCGSPLTPVAPAAEPVAEAAPVAAPVVEPASVAEPAPVTPAAETPAPVYQPAPAPAYSQPQPTYAPRPVYGQPLGAPAVKERPLIGVIVLTAIAMLFQIIHVVAILVRDYFGTSVYNSAPYHLITGTILTLFLISAIIPNGRLRSVFCGIATIALSLRSFALMVEYFSYVARTVADEYAVNSAETLLYVFEDIYIGSLLAVAGVFFLIGGIFAFIRLRGKGLRVTGSVFLLIMEASDLLFLFLEAAIFSESLYGSTVIVYIGTLMTAVASLAYFVSTKRLSE